MTDDTPTERFTPADEQDYAATRRLPVASTGAMPPVTPPPRTPPPGSAPEHPSSRALLYTLIGIGAALLIAILILALTLFNRDETPSPVDTATASPSSTPSVTPSATQEPEPEPTEEPEPPVATGPTFDSFSAPASAGCTGEVDNADLSFSWSSSNATKAYIGVATTNAKSEPFASDLPPVYTFTEIQYQCDLASQVYTVTLEDADGYLAHNTVTVTQ